MKKNYIIEACILVMVLLSLSCASGPRTRSVIYWEKQGANQEEFNRDKYQCTKETMVSWSGSGFGAIHARNSAAHQANELYTMCMRSKGYTDRVVEEPE